MTTDAEIIERSGRQPDAFAEIFDRHHLAVHAFVSRRAGAQAADDVLGEVFTAAFAQRERFASESGNALPWLYGIARNLTHRHFRRTLQEVRVADRWAHRQREHHTEDDRVVDAVDAARAWQCVQGALGDLPLVEREALLLFAWEELSYGEIAEVLGVPVGTVKSRIHRARAALRAALSTSVEEISR